MLVVDHVARYMGPKKFPAVVDVSLTVRPGSVHALLGPNGAGKTTTVRMCSTLLRPSAGTITVNGVDAVAHPERVRRDIGLVLGGDLGFYPRASGEDNLLYFADLQGVPSKHRKDRVVQTLARVGLTQDAEKPTQALSRGLKQRLHIARALLGEPSILLLDEPTTGLDPDVALLIRSLVQEVAQSGVGILLTSHSMPEVEELADEISLIGAGKIVAHGSVDDIAAFAGVGLVSSCMLPADAVNIGAELQEHLSARYPGVEVSSRPRTARWELQVFWPTAQAAASEKPLEQALVQPLDPERASETVLEFLSARGIQPTELLSRQATLEQAYLAAAQRLARS